MGRGKILRLTFALVLLLMGVILIQIAGTNPPGQSLFNLGLSLGLSLVVTGIVTGFRELAILRLETEDTGEDIAERISRRLQQSPPGITEDTKKDIVERIHRQLIEFPPGIGDIRMVTPGRSQYDGYYTWVDVTFPQNLFFAGRSVLHSMDRGIKALNLGSAEKVIARRLMDGSEIYILFIDPKSDIIDRLAREEHQNSDAMLFDIATSLGICKRLHLELEKNPRYPPRAQLHICIYDEVPYFSYHKEEDKVIIGFYFAASLGSMSAAFKVADKPTQYLFENHFASIFDRARASDKLILAISRGNAYFNETLYNDLFNFLTDKLGKERTDKAFSGS
jgi:hypothetical protein